MPRGRCRCNNPIRKKHIKERHATLCECARGEVTQLREEIKSVPRLRLSLDGPGFDRRRPCPCDRMRPVESGDGPSFLSPRWSLTSCSGGIARDSCSATLTPGTVPGRARLCDQPTKTKGKTGKSCTQWLSKRTRAKNSFAETC